MALSYDDEDEPVGECGHDNMCPISCVSVVHLTWLIPMKPSLEFSGYVVGQS